MQRELAAHHRTRRRRAQGLLVALCAVLLQPVAHALDARPGPRGGSALELPGQPPRLLAGISVDRVIEQIERQQNARVVRVDQKRTKDGRVVYELRLLSSEGRVWTVRIDAETGRMQ